MAVASVLLDPGNAPMNRGLYTAASGAVAALARLDAATHNVANVNTIGYKAERAVFELHPLDAGARAAVDPVLGRTAGQVRHQATIRDFSPGPTHQTGNPLDVAIDGAGFFAVATPRGERYTRAGNFALDREGYLVTATGLRVQGDAGDIQVGTGDVEIGADGTISADKAPVGRLKLVQLGEPPRVLAEGGALFAPAPGAVAGPLDDTEVRVVPGTLEGANVDAVAGLLALVDIARSYESYMHALRRFDQLAERAINEVGRVG